MKARLRRLERAVEETSYISIPQQDGSPERFRQSEVQEAFITALKRLKGELDVPEHPLSTAAANSSDAAWRETFVAGTHTVTGGGVVEDLSEP